MGRLGKTATYRFGFRGSMRHLFFIIATAVALASCKEEKPKPPPPTGPMALVVPEKGAYFGAYMDFGDTEDEVTLEKIDKFETLAEKKPAIIASSSYWGEQSFPKDNLALIARHGSVPMIYWSPWDKPYTEEKGPDRFSLKEILAGKWDNYIDMWADGAKTFGQPMFVSFCNEMNGAWFPWSGTFYGGGNGGPETFKAAWKYVVDRVRQRGAKNILWVFHVNNYSDILDNWNTFKSYYPGPDYVDWLGLSVYGKQFRRDDNPGWADFIDLIDWPYQVITAVDSSKPVMLAEFGVAEFSDIHPGAKAQWYTDAFSMMQKYPKLKAAIYWHERWQNPDSSYSNLRVDSSAQALAAFRKGVASPFWLSVPEYRPIEKR